MVEMSICEVEDIMAEKWELKMNHLILYKIPIYNLQFFLDEQPSYQGHMPIVGNTFAKLQTVIVKSDNVY